MKLTLDLIPTIGLLAVVLSQPTVVLSQVTVYNTFEDSVITGGSQAVFGAAGPTEIVQGTTEFPNFIGFYDVNVDDGIITLKLVDNSGATDLVLPPGRFDRYYFMMPEKIINAKVGMEKLNNYNACASVLEPGYTLEFGDPFGTGIPSSVVFPNGGILLEIGKGSDLTMLGQVVTVKYFTPKPQKVTVYNTFEDSIITGGVQAVFGKGGPVPIVRDTELPGFIGFYDLDVDFRKVTMKLIDNSGATDLILPEGRYDRYYIRLPKPVMGAEVVKAHLNNLEATVSVLKPGYKLDFADPFGTGIAGPVRFPKGGLLIQIAAGSDLTELEQILTVHYTPLLKGGGPKEDTCPFW